MKACVNKVVVCSLAVKPAIQHASVCIHHFHRCVLLKPTPDLSTRKQTSSRFGKVIARKIRWKPMIIRELDPTLRRCTGGRVAGFVRTMPRDASGGYTETNTGYRNTHLSGRRVFFSICHRYHFITRCGYVSKVRLRCFLSGLYSSYRRLKN